MIYHIFNSSLISGPETLVVPALAEIKDRAQIIWLRENRIEDEKQKHVASYFKSFGLIVHTIAVKSRFDKNAVYELKTLLENTKNLQVVHAHDVKPSFYLYEAIKKITNKNFLTVSTHHGVMRFGFINRVYEMVYTHFVLPKFDRTLTVCKADRARLINRGLNPEKVIAHLNGVTRNRISAEERTAEQKRIREVWGISVSDDTFVFGIAARIEVEKRLDLLLDLVVEIKKTFPDFKFVILIFGRGSLEQKLKEKTKNLNLEKQVIWMGYRLSLGQEFAGFDALLSVSKAEGLPINLIEAGWAATPVFATNINGVGDLISSERLGTLVTVDENVKVMASKLVEFASSKEKVILMGQRFQDHVAKHFSQAEWLKSLLDIYKIGKG